MAGTTWGPSYRYKYQPCLKQMFDNFINSLNSCRNKAAGSDVHNQTSHSDMSKSVFMLATVNLLSTIKTCQSYISMNQRWEAGKLTNNKIQQNKNLFICGSALLWSSKERQHPGWTMRHITTAMKMLLKNLNCILKTINVKHTSSLVLFLVYYFFPLSDRCLVINMSVLYQYSIVIIIIFFWSRSQLSLLVLVLVKAVWMTSPPASHLIFSFLQLQFQSCEWSRHRCCFSTSWCAPCFPEEKIRSVLLHLQLASSSLVWTQTGIKAWARVIPATFFSSSPPLCALIKFTHRPACSNTALQKKKKKKKNNQSAYLRERRALARLPSTANGSDQRYLNGGCKRADRRNRMESGERKKKGKKQWKFDTLKQELWGELGRREQSLCMEIREERMQW